MKYILICLVLLLGTSTAHAERMDYFKGLVNSLEVEVVPRLLDNLSSSDKEKLKDVNFILIENPAIVTAVYTESESKKIYISAGFLDGLYNLVDCLIINNTFNGNVCNKYFDYYFDQVVLKKPNPPYTYADLIFDNEAKLTSWLNNPVKNKTKNRIMMNALITIGMHEMGHHITGFSQQQDSVSTRREVEANADRWSINNLVRMGENPILGSVISLGYLSQMERFRRIKGVNSFSNHPAPKYRAEYTHQKSCNSPPPSSTNLKKFCNQIKQLIDTFE